ncbi:hypothetical protein A3C89_03520 [Candidatus Kaiserbacteria bacterium RIFCSPHIGHO2_02_FULL_50_50]|uniref:NadR/Ttd14 AAA domain-containing protein n=1 Tax=Candidatus Kaiserbacteria bacterium RIFCSPHIGHO2_02_FULL_50_50 TaxID=1798492 RepID=A0A1F6DBY7_9BACT|nr:MAG: hypothetical protein A3C89_03520 [Candidatus Kaiserbacteria bacterium RIFCSPHIGHO2_02_FULL_50_50]OGG88530.1 MAG: hypothetical protein A3G62_03410 [Candidatus Kaiserbacteria bacterium RIFCSPLOWO2_12_FULL_50_10]
MTGIVKKLVLTGGPCAGKTSALSFLEQNLRDRGWHVLVAPEIPTMLMQHGVHPNMLSTFQEHVLAMQVAFEKELSRAAEMLPGEKVVIIYDRGIMDQKVYLPNYAAFISLVEAQGLNVVEVRDGRYDGVFHLRTAAHGAEHAYGNATNAHRLESVEQARAVDKLTEEAWLGTPHLRIIPNKGTFADKLHHLLSEVLQALGEPVPIEFERKYTVRLTEAIPPIPSSVRVLITQDYLVATNPGVVERVRSRGQDATLLYYHTTKKPTGVCGESVEVERRISEREYLELLARKDPCRHTVVKERTCFVYRDQYFELDVFADTRLPHALLEIELLSEQQTVELPSFLDIIEEVTGDAAWSNFSIAHRLAQKD